MDKLSIKAGMNTALLAALSATLVACGGGASTTPTTPPVVTPPVVTPGNLLTTMPANPYVAGSADAKNFDEINRIRIAGGFGAAVEDPVMRKAAKAHEDYILASELAGLTLPGPHTETPGLPGFTGVTPQDRCVAAAVGTDAAGKISCAENGAGTSDPLSALNVMGLFSLATGHLQNILDYNANRLGLYLREDKTIPGQTSSGGTMNMGYRSDSMAKLDSDKSNSIVGIYPFDGMTGVGQGQGALNGRPIAPNVTTYDWLQGISILVRTSAGQTNPAVSAFTLRAEGAASDTPIIIHEAGTSASYTESTQKGWAIAFPKVVLSPNTKYTVNFAGTINGAAIQKQWSFTTGTAPMTRMGG